MLTVGAQVERYEVLAHLGGGGFAEVYRVRHVHLGTIHALKVLRPEHVANEQIRLRFLDEARVQAQLVHPNIARVTDIIVSQGIAGLVMEFLEGRSLADFIEDRQGPATEAEILAIMLPVLDALHFAHEKGVIHRDVKPDNIFLAVDDGGQQVPKVLDFGIAKVRGELRQEGKRKSTVATGMGTDGYAAPEQLRNAADVDRRADVFSVGVTLYELATGRLPFERDSDVDSLMALMAGDYSIPEEVRLGLPRVALAIGRALQTDRDDRCKDCMVFAAALASTPVNPSRTHAPEVTALRPAPAARSRMPPGTRSRESAKDDVSHAPYIEEDAARAAERLGSMTTMREVREELEKRNEVIIQRKKAARAAGGSGTGTGTGESSMAGCSSAVVIGLGLFGMVVLANLIDGC